MDELILVVDDEKEIAELVEVYLANNGCRVLKFYDAESALAYLDACADGEERYPDLAVLDVMLPDMDGFTLCKRIRESCLFPIIMLTAKIEDMDKINGLTLGADDYITKPFNPLELVARVRTQLRRYTRYNIGSAVRRENRDIRENGGDDGAAEDGGARDAAGIRDAAGTRAAYEYDEAAEADSVDVRGLHIERRRHKCTLNGKELSLTPIEFNILWYLCAHKGEVVPSEELFEAIWKEKYLDNNNTVMAHIARLREKLGEPPRRPKYVKTIWGVGYTVE